jgi:hypothetical protein
VNSTWIGERNSRTQQRKKPSYSHKQWNKFKEVVTEEAKTNNIVEGFINGFASSLPARASDWTIIDCFKMEESLAKNTPSGGHGQQLGRPDEEQKAQQEGT